jgi:hypothetical protein
MTPRGGERRLVCGDAAREGYESRALHIYAENDAELAAAWEREHEKQQKDKQHAPARVEEREIKPPIPLSPVLNPPRLFRPVPYIPETIAHLPPCSMDAIKAVCSPFLFFFCKIIIILKRG